MKKMHIAFIAGIVTGILIAPSTGATSRAKLADACNGLANKLLGRKKTNMYQNALDTIGEHIGART